MRGKLIVIEGSDASGKATQTELLYKKLLQENYRVKKVEFPNYKSKSSALVKMYLNGELGETPGDINPYAASTFYAVDRFASYKIEWQSFYEEGGIIIADRYTTSNMIHQAAKIKDKTQKDEFLNWLWELEFLLYLLPVPDKVFFLDIPPEYSKILMKSRDIKTTKKRKKDIHETNFEYMEDSYNNARYIANKYSWERIKCTNNNSIMTANEIHKIIY